MTYSEAVQRGIELQAFSAENADLILSWRNAEHVRANSLDETIIEKDVHLGFVERLASTPKVDFFVVVIDGIPAAVLNVDASSERAFWGCYLAPGNAPKPGVFPLLIMIAGHLAFNHYGVSELRSDVLEHNTPPQKMNAFLGIPVIGRRTVKRASGTEIEVLEYCIGPEDFAEVKSIAVKLLTRHYRESFDAFAALNGESTT
ncbi:hypothetical protein HCG46_08805 [Labrenzia sp. PO1]|uniref:hypothetical protein n=1 Tax=Labrenzia sp. PO1 TaxID=2720390 RepID=UPI001447F44D|nr:hypothetical protein [Labrenzia sp. PO1]NKI58356.1 hypothetical protein [Labrenzia sp. PO1]